MPVVGEREHVHPGVHAQPGGVGVGQKLGERVHAVGLAQAPVGGGVGEARVEPGAASAVDLHEEVRSAERACVFDQTGNLRGVVEHALAALAQHPQPAAPGRRLLDGRFVLAATAG